MRRHRAILVCEERLTHRAARLLSDAAAQPWAADAAADEVIE
jgi:hypothetical protein